MLSQEAQVRWVFPLTVPTDCKAASVIFEPDEETVLNTAVPEYVAGILVSAVRESFASEVAARRCAMDSAGKNAQQMIDSLQLDYNRARQGAITQEITEIVAGSGM
jgi:F-type H+-transporting ATPase subunit gamma